jgi:hypothetical protein
MARRRSFLASLLSFVLVFGIACDAATIQAYINLIEKISLQLVLLSGAPQSQVDKISGDLARANKLYGDLASAGTNKDSVLERIDAELAAAQNDLGDILALARVKDQKTVTAVRAGLAVAIVAVEGFYTLAHQNGTSIPKKAFRTTVAIVPLPNVLIPKGKTMSPAQLQEAYNQALAGYPQAQLR